MAAFADITATGVQVQATIGTAEVIFASDPAIVTPEPLLFIRAVSGLGTSYAVGKGNNSPTGEVRVLSRGGTISASLGGSYGNYCVGVIIVGSQVMVVWVSSTSQYSSQLFSSTLVSAGAATTHAIPAAFTGTSQGFTDLTAAGVPIWTDSYARPYVVRGLPLIYPATRSSYWIGQGGGTLPAQICGCAPNGRRFTLFSGDAFEPHLAGSASTTLYWAARSLNSGPQFGTIDPAALPAFVGSIDGGSQGADDALAALGDADLYPPVRHPVDRRQQPSGDLMTKEWQRWAQKVSGVAALALSQSQVISEPGIVPDVPGLPPGSGGSGSIQLLGDVTGGPTPSPVTTTIANDAVTYAKMQNVSAASRVLGRGSAAGSGDVQELTLGVGLTMTGTVVSATGGVIPLVTGAEPVELVSNGAGQLIVTAYP